MISLSNKIVLLIAPKYFGYEKLIKEAIERHGAKVILYYENLDAVSFWYRFIYVYYTKFKNKVLDKRYFKIARKFEDDIDIVLVIRGSSCSENTMKLFRKVFKQNCFFILYQWDSVENNNNAINIAKYFDRVLTFDIADSKKYGWKYRPLFYISDESIEYNVRSIDAAYICSIHSKRVEVYRKIQSSANENIIKLYKHIYSDPKFFIKRKYINRATEFRDLKISEVDFRKMDNYRLNKIYSDCKIIIDYTHPLQTGYTMRTIESLGHKCKLITNNKNIYDADFYTPENILVYDDTNAKIPLQFLTMPYKYCDANLYERYSLETWIKEIFDDNQGFKN